MTHPLDGAAPVHSPDERCSWAACQVCFPRAEPDVESAALAACVRALSPLDQTARARVLEYLGRRLNLRGGV